MKNEITNKVNGCFSIRSYTRQAKCHAHSYHQLVMPVQGSITIIVGDYHGMVSVGDCVVIKAGLSHEFSAAEDARFLVIDTEYLPCQVINTEAPTFSLSPSLLAFVHFIEQQLVTVISASLVEKLYTLFYELLSTHDISKKKDKRIEKAIALITNDLSQTYTNLEIAQHVYLSVTQFKHLFKSQMGLSCQSYITQLRINKAKALLSYTDTPISLIAEQVGYLNASAFSRKFREQVGVSPSHFNK